MADEHAPASNLVQEAKEALPEIAVADWTPPAIATPTAREDGEMNARAEDEAEVIRQIEYYFSEENLPHDAHLLGLFEEGGGTVSFNEICGFKAMRKFKPKTWVRDVLKRSALVEVCENGKRLRRKVPLQTTPTVAPKVKRDTPKGVLADDQPWMTKALSKPTGFEEDATSSHITPEDLEQDRIDYPSDQAFTQRIELAITRFCARRTMHELVRKIFEKYLLFSGFRTGQAQFVGGMDGKAMEEYTKKEIAEMTQYYGISQQVLDGLDDDPEKSTWVVEFEAVAKAFLSSQFPSFFAWYDDLTIKTATDALRNFHNYLLQHKVCPEYADQIKAAIKICDLAAEELPRLHEFDRNLPGGFNVACSMLFEGHHASQLARGDWAQGVEGGSWNQEEALMAFKTHVHAHGTQEQISKMESAQGTQMSFEIVFENQLGLEVVAMEMPGDEVTAVYDHFRTDNTIVKPMGKMRCTVWKVPTAAPVDLPDFVKNADPTREYEFLVETSTLRYCTPGFKFTATVKQLDIGVTWIDYHEATYASFFTWLHNERIRDWKEPGPPKAWMERQNAREKGPYGADEMVLEPGKVADDDDELD